MGMFDGLLNRAQTERDAEEQRRMRLGQMNEGQRLGYYAVSGGADAGQALGRGIGTALGADMRTEGERATDKVRAVEAAVQGLDPNEPDYLLKLARAFQQAGMVEEAANAQKAYESQVGSREKRATEKAESERKAAKDKRDAEVRMAGVEVNKQKLGMMGPKLVQYGNAFDAIMNQIDALEPGDPRMSQLVVRADQLMQAMANESRGTLKYVNAGDRVYVQNANGETIKELAVGAKPGSGAKSAKDEQKRADAMIEAENAYKSTKAQLQETHNLIARLYNHPGLEKFVGPVIGAAAQTPPEKGGFVGNVAAAAARGRDGEAAYALFQSVQGGTLINALTDLKEKSKTGASGLGALSEVEGSKLQAAKAALNPQQDPAAFRQNLKVYADVIADTARRLDEKAASYQMTAVPLQPAQFTGPQRRVAPAKPAASAAPAAPAAPAASRQEWVRDANGKLVPKGK